MLKVPSIFIGSSTRTLKLAQALEVLLTADGNIQCDIWNRDQFSPGKTTINSLIEAAQKHDFAAFLLTRDDVTIRANDPANARLSPRDNCIFELGLFMGALGLNPERSLIVTSLGQDSLPSDLKGITYVSFEEPGNLSATSGTECKQIMRQACIKINDKIETLGRFARPIGRCIGFDDIRNLEKLISEGGNLKPNGKVVIHASEPLETDYSFAVRVLANMKIGIKYHYFFAYEQNAIDMIAEMLRVLSVVSIKKDNNQLSSQIWDNMTEEDKKNMLEDKNNHKIIKNNLKEIASNLFVHFLPYSKISEEFFIHNAGSGEYGKCYLRWDRQCFTQLAGYKAEIKYNAYLIFQHSWTNSVFGTSKYLNINDVNRKLNLIDTIKKQFPSSLAGIVEDTCFGT